MKKRMKLTKNGKIKRFKAGRRHLMAEKSGKRRRKLRSAGMVAKSQVKLMTRLIAPGS